MFPPRRFPATVLIGLAACSLAACSGHPTARIRTEAAPDATLASYRTYSWSYDAGGSPFTREQVREAFDAALGQAGYSKVESEGDMQLGFTIGARDKVDVTDWGPVAPYYPAYGRAYNFGWAYNYRDVDVRMSTEGSMALDVYDRETDKPVWHGIAEARISSRGVSDQEITAAASRLVAALRKDATPP